MSIIKTTPNHVATTTGAPISANKPSAVQKNTLPVQQTKSVLVNLSKDAVAMAASLTNTNLSTASVASATIPSITFDGIRTSTYEQKASTGLVTQTSGNTGQATITLTAGKTYSFNAAFGYSYSKTKPSVTMSVIDSTGKVVFTNTSPQTAKSFTVTKSDTYTLKIEASNATKTITNNAILTSYNLNVQEAKAILPASSGNKNVDALISGSWWHDVGSTVTTDPNSPITTGLASLSASSAKHTITYSFLDNSSYSWLSTADKKGFGTLDSNQEAAVKKAFDYLSTVINVTFVKANSVAASNITFGMNDQTSSAGYALYPHANGNNPSVLMLDNTKNDGNSGTNLGTLGSYGWETLIHEIGHTLGLKHPGNYNAGGGSTPGPYLPTPTDNRRMAIMSYNNPTDGYSINATAPTANSYSWSASAVNPTTYGVYDLAALQYLYGANKTTATTDVLSLTDSYKTMQTLWAPTGIILDASATTKSNLFDLRGGAYSSVAIRNNTDAIADVAAQLIASNKALSQTQATTNATNIMKAKSSIGTATGGTTQVANSALYYTGKNDLGLAYGSQMSEVKGGSAADSFYISNYNTSLDGGSETDTLYLTGKSTDWTIGSSKLTGTTGNFSQASFKLVNTITKVEISVSNIEKYAFYNDLTLAMTH